MVRFARVGLIALATVASLSPGQHPFNCAEAYNSYLQDLVRRGCRPKTVQPCNCGRSALTTLARRVI